MAQGLHLSTAAYRPCQDDDLADGPLKVHSDKEGSWAEGDEPQRQRPYNPPLRSITQWFNCGRLADGGRVADGGADAAAGPQQKSTDAVPGASSDQAPDCSAAEEVAPPARAKAAGNDAPTLAMRMDPHGCLVAAPTPAQPSSDEDGASPSRRADEHNLSLIAGLLPQVVHNSLEFSLGQAYSLAAPMSDLGSAGYAGALPGDFYGASEPVCRGGIGVCEGVGPSVKAISSGDALVAAAAEAKLRWASLYGREQAVAAPVGGAGEVVKAGARGGRRRRQLDQGKLKEALEVAAASAEAEKSGLSDWVENVWEEALTLEPLLSLTAHPHFTAPANFVQSMDTCMACLLHAPADHLRHTDRMVRLCDSQDLDPLLKYLEWLKNTLEDLSPCFRVSTACRAASATQKVGSALTSWQSECGLLQKTAMALCEALLTHGPEHCRNYADWRKAVDSRDSIQCQQEEECMQIARDLEEATAHFTSQLQDLSGDEWTHLARTSHASLSKIQQLTTELLQQQREVWSDALEEYEALGAQATTCRAAVCEARRQIKRHEQAFRQAVRRYTDVASQMVAWTSTMVPKLQLIMSNKERLRSLVVMRRRLPALELEHLAAEDELDMAQTELRKHKRHSQRVNAARPTIDQTAGAILERQYEMRVQHGEERVRKLMEDVLETERQIKDAEACILPLVAEPDDDGDGPDSQEAGDGQQEHLTPEERLALKLATLEQFHEDVAMSVSQVQAERDQVLKQVAERKEQAAAKMQIEQDFMCPIMHEKMSEPVLAADGHTYERQAIEKWLQLHNTSPMTGAPLAHRYLTENFSLRNVIASYDARMKVKENMDEDGLTTGLSGVSEFEDDEWDGAGDDDD